MVPARACLHETDRANPCGGHLASITTTREKAIVDYLANIAIEDVASRDFETAEIVWIGGTQLEGMSDSGPEDPSNVTWGWSDGSQWFDNEGEPTYKKPGLKKPGSERLF